MFTMRTFFPTQPAAIVSLRSSAGDALPGRAGAWGLGPGLQPASLPRGPNPFADPAGWDPTPEWKKEPEARPTGREGGGEYPPHPRGGAWEGLFPHSSSILPTPSSLSKIPNRLHPTEGIPGFWPASGAQPCWGRGGGQGSGVGHQGGEGTPSWDSQPHRLRSTVGTGLWAPLVLTSVVGSSPSRPERGASRGPSRRPGRGGQSWRGGPCAPR